MPGKYKLKVNREHNIYTDCCNSNDSLCSHHALLLSCNACRGVHLPGFNSEEATDKVINTYTVTLSKVHDASIMTVLQTHSIRISTRLFQPSFSSKCVVQMLYD